VRIGVIKERLVFGFLIFALLAFGFFVLACGEGYAVEIEEEDFRITIESTIQEQITIIEEQPMNILAVLGGGINILAALFEKWIASGEPGVLVLNMNEGLLMVDGVLVDLNVIVLTWGYVFPGNNGAVEGWGLGIKIRFSRIEFLKDVMILKELNPGVGFYGNKSYVIFGVDLFK